MSRESERSLPRVPESTLPSIVKCLGHALLVGLVLVVAGCGKASTSAPERNAAKPAAQKTQNLPAAKTVAMPAKPAPKTPPSEPNPPIPRPAWNAFFRQTVRGIPVGDGRHRIDRASQGNQLTDAQSTLAVEMRDLGKEVPLLRAQGKEQEAIRKLEGFVAITRELWGETSTSMDVLPALAILYQNVGRYEDALAVLTFIENLPPNVIKLPPAELAANKRLRSQLLKIVAMSPTDRERYQDERRLTTEAAALHLRGEYAKALVFSREADRKSVV